MPKIGCVETFGEPTVNRRKQIMSFGPSALLAPQPSQAHRGAQFEGFGLLLSRDAQCFPKCALALVRSVATNKREACEAVV